MTTNELREAAQHEASADQERPAFEAWAASWWPNGGPPASAWDGWMARAALTATTNEAAAKPDERASEICLPNGLPFDAYGAPRTRYVRVSLGDSHCVMHTSEGDTYLDDAKRFGDESEYVVADVYLSEREFDDLGEFDGF